MRRHLLMRLRAPLIAFGGEMIDNYGVIREFPALSMVTGLIANAFGWDRGEFDLHDKLQAQLVMGTRLDLVAKPLRDFQTAQLGANDSGWTTCGEPETRRGGDPTYESPHLRYRDYHADLDALVALRLDPADDPATLDDIAHALNKPARPLFIGRKPCLPSAMLFAGFVEGEGVLRALQRAPLPESNGKHVFRFQWPQGEGAWRNAQALDICDERNWKSGVHGGWRPVLQVSIDREELESFSPLSPELPA